METVKDRRERLGYTQEALAERCGCHFSTISHIECGREKPSLSLFARMADELRVSPTKLLDMLNVRAVKGAPKSSTDLQTGGERQQRR